MAPVRTKLPSAKQVAMMSYEELGAYLKSPFLKDQEFAMACAAHPDIKVVRAVAMDASTHPDMLEKLAAHDDLNVVENVAGNPSTPSHVLMGLLGHPSYTVQVALAWNPGADDELLKRLALFQNLRVVAGVVRNPNATPALLTELAKHKDPDIRKLVDIYERKKSKPLPKFVPRSKRGS